MDILLIEKDPMVRDQLKMALQQFPGIQVTLGSGYRGINELRSRRFDCVFLGADLREAEAVMQLAHLRSFDAETEVVLLTPTKEQKALATEKQRSNIHTFLRTPLDPKEVFAFLGRFLERSGKGAGRQKAARAGEPAAPAR
jgi:DNA-binding NtrC family response regulator